jgi:MFS family permease
MPSPSSRWYTILQQPRGVLLALCTFWLGVQAAAIAPLLPILISQWGGLDKGQVVVFFVISTLAGMVWNLTTGQLSDGRVPRWAVVAAGALLTSVGTAGVTWAGPPGQLYFFGALTGGNMVIMSQLFAVAQTSVMKPWARPARVVGLTVLRTGFSLGFIVGTGLASLLLLVLELRALFWVMTASGLALGAVAALVVIRTERWGATQPDPEPEFFDPGTMSAPPAPKPVFTWKSLVLPLVALSLMQGADRARMVYLPLVSFSVFQDARWAPLLFGITAATELITMVVVGSLAARIGERVTIVAGAVWGAVCFALMGLFPNLPVLFVTNVAYSVFVAMLLGVAMAYIQGLLVNRPGLGGSLFILTRNVGALIGTLVPLAVPGYSPLIFLLPAALCGAGALLMAGPGFLRRAVRV